MKTLLAVNKHLLIIALLSLNAAIAQAVVLHDNGPLINSPGSGVGGADESILQSVSLGLSFFGFSHEVVDGRVVADDFTIPAGEDWIIDGITIYAYQVGSSTISTLTDIRVQIWDGPPAAPGSNVVFGDLTTNRLASTAFSNIYRVSEATMGGAIDRPIMVNEVTIGVALPPGAYWLAWQVDGTIVGLSVGPFAPPVTINGQDTTGNGLNSLDNGLTYGPANDPGTDTQQGFPFIINGEALPNEPIPTLSEWSLIILSLLLLMSGLLARRSQRNFFE